MNPEFLNAVNAACTAAFGGPGATVTVTTTVTITPPDNVGAPAFGATGSPSEVQAQLAASLDAAAKATEARIAQAATVAIDALRAAVL